jgi:formate hydrogenlyase subunit 6/NADH:ubiquinone oxidoreductase subunit I
MLGTVILIAVGVVVAAVILLWLFGERWRLLRPSTWKMMREGGFHPLGGLHGYVYGRWSNQYVKVLTHYIVPHLGPRLGQWLADRYHGKVLTKEHARAIITLDKEIPLQDLEQVIPYATARDLVLKGPPAVAVYECACRHARANPCQPTQVCMAIGQPFVDFTLEHNPQSSRRLTQAEALDLLGAERERGHLHSAWFKDACLNRFYAICNCCTCCCGGIETMTKYGIPTVAPSGYVAHTDEDLCTACGTCADACPFGALSVEGDENVLNWEKCMGGGVCVEKCSNDATSLVRDERKGLPLDVRLLAREQTTP